jgi:hypothetical protein
VRDVNWPDALGGARGLPGPSESKCRKLPPKPSSRLVGLGLLVNDDVDWAVFPPKNEDTLESIDIARGLNKSK